MKLLFVVFALASVKSTAQSVFPISVPKAGEIVDLGNTEMGDVVVLQLNEGGFLFPSIWNGLTWTTLGQIPQFYGTYKQDFSVKTYFHHKDVHYYIIEKSLNFGFDRYELWKWSKGVWKKDESNIFNRALDIERLINFKDELHCVGKFIINGARYNMAVLSSDGNWELRGNLLTRNLSNDVFSDVSISDNRLYVTGQFTVPSSSSKSMAHWDGNVWQYQQYPPFTNENIALGTFKGATVAYGKVSDNDYRIRIQQGTAWTDASVGLESIQINDFKKFVSANNNLFAFGTFKTKESENVAQLLLYEGEHWKPIHLGEIDATLVSTFENKIVFGSNSVGLQGVLPNIGILNLEQAVIEVGVFEDKNGNCVKDEGERLLKDITLEEPNKLIGITTNEFGNAYFSVQPSKFQLGIATNQSVVSTCPDLYINADSVLTYEKNYLGVKYKTSQYDLSVNVTDDQGAFFIPNLKKRLRICAKNEGVLDVNTSQLNLSHNGILGQVESSTSFSKISANNIVWEIGAIAAQTEVCLDVLFYIESEQEDFEVAVELMMTSEGQEINLANNKYTFAYQKGNPHPFNKACANGKQLSTRTSNLSYHINYENTTKDVVTKMTVIDELDEQLYLNSGISYTSELGAKLHRTYKELPNGNFKYTCVWVFEDLNLLPGEQGSISFNFDLFPNKLLNGSEICNSAKVFFENANGYQFEPNTTNKVCTEVTEQVSVAAPSIDKYKTVGLTLVPNPTKDKIQVRNTTAKNLQIEFINALGQQMLVLAVLANSDISLPVHTWTSGIYFVRVNGIIQEKLIIY